MNFRDLFSQLHSSPRPIEKFIELSSVDGSCKPTKSDVEEALNQFSAAISRNRQGRALSTARVLLLLLGADKAVKRVQRLGTFRPSRQAFSSSAGQAVIADWIEHSAIYSLSQRSIGYLKSVDALWSLAPELRKLRISLIERLKVKRPRSIKTLLATVDVAFSFGWEGHFSLPTESVYAHTSEGLAEAFSFLLHLFHKEIGLSRKDFGLLDSDASVSGFYQDLLVDAVKICEYLEAEVLVESFPYSAKVSDGKVVVSADEPRLEKSVRLGYVQAELQKEIRLQMLRKSVGNQTSNIQSFTRFAEDFYRGIGDELIEFVSTPAPRYRMTLPAVEPLRQIFSGNGLFIEDLWSLNNLGIEDYVEPEAIVDLPVVGNITVIDILKIQRFFGFVLFGMRMALENSPISQRSLIWLNSCLPVFEKKALIETMQQLLGVEKAEEMLRLLTCDISSDYVDLQYSPIIETDGLCMLSMAILTSSNLVRNILCHYEQRLTMRGKEEPDPMQQALRDALQRAGFLVEVEVNTGTKNNPLEVDVLAYKDGHLFLFECKNSFHPCNIYEMRTSYEHVEHAADQLTKRRAWLSDPTNQRRVFDRLSWRGVEVCSVHTCIAIGNRVFNGYEYDSHPVRQVHELLNVLLRGFVVIDGVKRRLWQAETFSVSDLCAHIQGATVVGDLMDSMEPTERTLLFYSNELTFSRYFVDMQRLKEISEAKYPKMGGDSPEGSLKS